MTPEEQAQFKALQDKVNSLEKEQANFKQAYASENFPERMSMKNRYLETFDFRAKGFIRLGTATTDKVGFFGVTPVVQQANILAPTGGATVDTESRNAIVSILNVLDALGFTG